MTAALRLELFAHHLSATIQFYERILGFERVQEKPDGSTVLRLGTATVDVQPMLHLPVSHPLLPKLQERVGLGIELVLEVDDVDAFYERVAATGWAIAAPLKEQPWGLRDFRLADPDGRQLRISSRP